MSRTRHLVRSSVLVIAVFGLSKLTGLIKLFLNTAIFGTSPAADAFAAANQLPELFLAMLSGGAVAAALIPVYSSRMAAQDGSAARLADRVMTLTLLSVGSICALAALAAPWIVSELLVPHFSPEQQALTARLMRIILFSSFLISIGSIFSSLLHAHQHFFLPALATVVIDLGQIWGLLFWTENMGIVGAAWGSVLGAFLLTAVQLPGILNRRIHLRIRFGLRADGMGELLHLLWPRVVTLGIFQAVDLVFLRLASPLPSGAISAFFYAMLAMVAMPKGLIASAISSVLFPTLAEAFNLGERSRLRRTLVHGLRTTWLFLIPAGLGLVLLGRPAVAFLFERGSFDATSTLLVYSLMAILSLRLVGDATADILSLSFFARHDTRTIMWAHLVWAVLNVLLSALLVGRFGIFGLAAASSLASISLALALFGLDRPFATPQEGRRLLHSLGRMGVALAAMGAVLVIVRHIEMPVILYLITGISLGGLVYLITYYLLGGRELATAWTMLVGRNPSE